MAVAWIAWRDLEQTRRQSAAFRSESTYWLFREWNQPIKGGTAFARRAGWFLENWPKPTTVQLALLEKILAAESKLPAMRQMTVLEAEQALWRALSEARLIAEALDGSGRPVDIPAREWAYLKLFEDGKEDALKYDAIDSRKPFTRVHLKRDDLLRLWPRIATYATADEYTAWPLEASMLKPISDAGNAGYVPLCAAVLWIVSDGGKRLVPIDRAAWDAGVQKLWPEICTGEIELIGLAAGQTFPARIPGHSLVLMKVLSPLNISLSEALLSSRSFIQCTSYPDADQWQQQFNDELYESGRVDAAWTHLQVRKSDILDRWPRASSKVKVEQDCRRWLVEQMRASPSKTRSRGQFLVDAQQLFPTLAVRQFGRAWHHAIAESGADAWTRKGRLPRKSKHSGS
jgi:hypothetical protein